MSRNSRLKATILSILIVYMDFIGLTHSRCPDVLLSYHGSLIVLLWFWGQPTGYTSSTKHGCPDWVHIRLCWNGKEYSRVVSQVGSWFVPHLLWFSFSRILQGPRWRTCRPESKHALQVFILLESCSLSNERECGLISEDNERRTADLYLYVYIVLYFCILQVVYASCYVRTLHRWSKSFLN